MLNCLSKNMMMSALKPYKPETVLFESSTPGTYNIALAGSGKYETYCIAGGGRASGSKKQISVGMGKMDSYGAGGGGSGSGFIGTIKMSKGILPVVVGGPSGDSSIGNYIQSYKGGDAWSSRNSGGAGAGGIAPTINAAVTSQTLCSSGNSGQSYNSYAGSKTAYGGASVYGGHGAGASIYKDGSASGAPGYVKIIYKG